MRRFLAVLAGAVTAFAALTDSNLQTFPNSLQLANDFIPVKGAYWTNRPKHRRTPFAISPDGKSAFLAYLDAKGTDVHVQQVDPVSFKSVGTPVTVTGGKEAGGLVAHNDGFALLTNEVMPSTTANAPPGNTPVAVVYRYTSGQYSWKTLLGGPDVHPADGLSMTPDINGDLVWSEKAQLYGAYFVVTDYQGWAAGHFGDSIQYINPTGGINTNTKVSSSWGCSHNTGIAFEAADAPPFASICAEDHGAVWLNTQTRGMTGVKISNEYIINGASNEPMGGMSGSYSNLARYQSSDAYVFAWVSRGAVNLTQDTWRGAGYTQAAARTQYRRVALANLSDKSTLVGPQAISTVGAADGDSQINWLSDGPADASNPRVATFDGTNALVTWEQIDSPTCSDPAMDCHGTFSGTYYQLVTGGKKNGAPLVKMDSFVAGDMVNMPDGRICWPYVQMAWQLSNPVPANPASTKQISFACMSNGAAGSAPAPSSSSATPAVPAASSTAASIAAAAPSATPSSSSAPAPAPAASSSSNAAPASSSPPTTTVAAAASSVVATSSAMPVINAPSLSSSSAAMTPAASPITAEYDSTASTAAPDSTMTVTRTSTEIDCKVVWTTVYV